MIKAERYQPALDNITNDIRRWYQNRDITNKEILGLYRRDLVVASENLEDLIEEDLTQDAFIRLNLGEAAAIGTIFDTAPMQSLYPRNVEATPKSVIALDHVWHIDSIDYGRRIFERHFGNGVIYFTSRALAVALSEGSNMTIEDSRNKPDHWSHRVEAE